MLINVSYKINERQNSIIFNGEKGFNEWLELVSKSFNLRILRKEIISNKSFY